MTFQEYEKLVKEEIRFLKLEDLNHLDKFYLTENKVVYKNNVFTVLDQKSPEKPKWISRNMFWCLKFNIQTNDLSTCGVWTGVEVMKI
jgi:hypothetical protein